MPDETRSPETPATDVGDEDWEFPDASELEPHEAAALWSKIEDEATAANKRAKRLKERKAAAKELTYQVIEASPYSSVRVPEGEREYDVTPYEFDAYNVVDEEAFQEWTKTNPRGRDMYDTTPRRREQVFQDYMRLLTQNKQPLPPGVSRYSETRISKTVVPIRRAKRR